MRQDDTVRLLEAVPLVPPWDGITVIPKPFDLAEVVRVLVATVGPAALTGLNAVS